MTYSCVEMWDVKEFHWSSMGNPLFYKKWGSFQCTEVDIRTCGKVISIQMLLRRTMIMISLCEEAHELWELHWCFNKTESNLNYLRSRCMRSWRIYFRQPYPYNNLWSKCQSEVYKSQFLFFNFIAWISWVEIVKIHDTKQNIGYIGNIWRKQSGE